MKPAKATLLRAAILHYLAYVIMQLLALLAETRRGPVINDLLHDLVPVVPAFEIVNTTVWMSLLLITLVYLAIKNRAACINYLHIGALVSLFRGVFISLTSLGPPAAKEATPFMQEFSWQQLNLSIFLKQVFPVDVLWGGQAYSAAYLTQDLMFSGHTASTFLFLLVVQEKKSGLFNALLLYHLLTVVALLFTHEHYTIDILAAYFIVYATYAFFRARNWLVK